MKIDYLQLILHRHDLFVKDDYYSAANAMAFGKTASQCPRSAAPEVTKLVEESRYLKLYENTYWNPAPQGDFPGELA